MGFSKRARLAELCVYIIVSLAIAKSQEVLSSIEEQSGPISKLLVREKRHSLKFGQCEPIQTHLGQGIQVLHEMPVRREKFFIRPRSTFSKMTLQIKLDNTLSQSAPKVYGDSVKFSDIDLKTLSYNGWIEVIAEASKYKKFGPDYWQIRLTVGTWNREVIVYRWWKIYAFDSLVISGEGGCDWTFDCYPDLAVDAGEQEALELDLTDDRWWLAGMVVGAVVLLILLVLFGVWCHQRKQPDGPGDYISKSISFRKSKSKTACEEIYEELGSPSLNRLREKMAGYDGEMPPPPLPAPNLPREGGYTTVMPPKKKVIRDVHDNEWFGSLELHSTDGRMDDLCKETEITSSTQPQKKLAHDTGRGDHSATEGRGVEPNHYSNTPTVNSSTYVDMRLIRKAPSSE